jgi:hypothetical protein
VKSKDSLTAMKCPCRKEAFCEVGPHDLPQLISDYVHKPLMQDQCFVVAVDVGTGSARAGVLDKTGPHGRAGGISNFDEPPRRG